MTTEELIIAIVRVLGSLPVLFFPFPGSIIAMLTDLSDLFLMNGIHAGGVGNYQEFDKWLDQVYMLTFLIVALRWNGVARTVAVVLYVYRLIGFATFEISGERDILLAFPNLFEFWFVFVAGLKFFHLEADDVDHPPEADRSVNQHFANLLPFRYTTGQLVAVLPVLLAVKLFQEYTLHVGRWLDGFTALEAVEAIWRFLTPPY